MIIRIVNCIAFLALMSLFVGVSELSSQSRRAPTPATQAELPISQPVPDPQSTPPAIDEDDIIAVSTRLVTIPVRVLDRNGRFIPGLDQGSFRVFEENVEQKVEHFSTASQPFTVALVLDMSYSAKFKAEQIQAAAISFINQLRPDDRVMVISFAEDVHIHCPPTNDRKEIYRAIRETRIETGTSLYDAVDSTMNEYLRSIEGRKAIILFTDGVDTSSSRSNDRANLRDALELDALIYPILYDTFAEVQAMRNRSVVIRQETGRPHTPPISPSGKSPFPLPVPVIGTPSDRGTTREEYDHGERYLYDLASRTGGTVIRADTLGNLDRAFSRIAGELREYYSLAYYPSEESATGRLRRIRVRVDMPNVAVRARESYTVPKTRDRE
jgi:VWFA-related protein